jgi:hypothetical protein
VQESATKETKGTELLIHKARLNTWVIFNGRGQANKKPGDGQFLGIQCSSSSLKNKIFSLQFSKDKLLCDCSDTGQTMHNDP